MDRIDKKILKLLQQNSKINNQELAEEVALSPSPCLRRVKQLEDEGYIQGYVALLNPEKLGLQLTILVSVGLDSHDPKLMARFEALMQSFPHVIQCDLIAGHAHDYMLRVVVQNLNEYQTFLLNQLTQIEGVRAVNSSFVLRSFDKKSLPLDHL